MSFIARLLGLPAREASLLNIQGLQHWSCRKSARWWAPDIRTPLNDMFGPRCLRLFWEGSAGLRGLAAWGTGCWEGRWVGTCLGDEEHERGSWLGRCLLLMFPWAGRMPWILGMIEAFLQGLATFCPSLFQWGRSLMLWFTLTLWMWRSGLKDLPRYQHKQDHRQEGEIPLTTLSFCSQMGKGLTLAGLATCPTPSPTTSIPKPTSHSDRVSSLHTKSITTGEQVNYNHRINAAVSKFTQLQQRFKTRGQRQETFIDSSRAGVGVWTCPQADLDSRPTQFSSLSRLSPIL